MYIVTIYNNGVPTEIHGEKNKLSSGSVVKGLNSIDSFSFCMLPPNPGFGILHERKTLIDVFNTNRNRYEFYGRVLYSNPSMSDSGFIKHDAVAESYLGFLQDSEQEYVEERNWTVKGLLQHAIDIHNSQTEEYKHFVLGNVTVTDPNDNLYCGIQREKTWKTLQDKLLNVLGGELSFRVVDGVNYLDYLVEIGEHKTTKIALSRNMKAITKEKDVSEFVTRLIPLGAKKTKTIIKEDGTTETVESEERLDITSVNNGKNYIVDEAAEAEYGINVKSVSWDDVTVAANLMTKGEQWLATNNKVQVKYSVTALDLSLIGLEIDDFDVGNYHPLVNPLIGVDDVARIIKKNINVCDEMKSTFEVGENFKSLSDIQREQAEQTQIAAQSVKELEKKSTTVEQQLVLINKELAGVDTKIEETYTSKIEQFSKSISLSIDGSLGSNASIILSANGNKYTGTMDLTQVRKAFADDSTAVSITAGTITFNAGTLIINSGNFTLDAEGTITANAGTVGGWTLKNYKLYAGDGVNIKTVCLQAPTANNLYVFAAGGTSHDSYADCPFRVTKAGKLYATDAIVYGDIITIDGVFKTEMDKGSIRLYYSDVLCGTINTKYWTGAATEGISLRVEEGGNYIMFSHADDTQGSGYVVDYYLNAGWSTNYDEMHIFQTSARFLSDVYFDGTTDIGSLVLRGPGGKRYLVTAYDGVLECSEI